MVLANALKFKVSWEPAVGFEPTACRLRIYWWADCGYPALSTSADYFRVCDVSYVASVRQMCAMVGALGCQFGC
jgi:hypothetical protein